jgi:hypothetical protein
MLHDQILIEALKKAIQRESGQAVRDQQSTFSNTSR